MTHICVSKLTITGSGNGLSPERRQANIWTNAGILLIGTLGTNFSEILSEIHTFEFKKMHLKTSSAKRRPFCLGLNVLTQFVLTLILYSQFISHHYLLVAHASDANTFSCFFKTIQHEQQHLRNCTPTSANNSILAGVQYIFKHKILPQHWPLSN